MSGKKGTLPSIPAWIGLAAISTLKVKCGGEILEKSSGGKNLEGRESRIAALLLASTSHL